MPEPTGEHHAEQRQAPSRNNPLIKPFVVLALPGMYLFYKYNQYKRKRKENATRRLAERELQHLNSKIEKLLSKLEESEPELATCREEECVICIHAKATMQTSPCDHQVVCRRCFVKTIQIAVSQRLLPLRCVICRSKILRLKNGRPMLPSSISGYSMTSRDSSVPASDSLYSVSSGGSSISSSSSSSDVAHLKHQTAAGRKCCDGHCVGGAYPRQPSTGAIRRSQKQEMKMTLKDYCRAEKRHINRLPPIRESSPLHSVPPASTRIRCAQKIITQLELPFLGRSSKGNKYEKLQQTDEEDELANVNPSKNSFKEKNDKKPEDRKRWWSDRTKSEERIDNKKNEILEKSMEMKEKLIVIKNTKGKLKEIRDEKL